MFNPEMMKLAQEQMKRMTPEQMQQMQQMQQNMDPETMRQAMAQVGNMRPQDIARARQQMAGMDPEEMMKATKNMDKDKLKQATAQYNAHATATKDYDYRASEELKAKGNKFVSNGDYTEAAEQYTRALDNLAGNDKPGASALRVGCQLNLALCHLKLGKNESVVTICTEVVCTKGDNVKALYRRALALKEMGKLEAAATDLRRAHKQFPNNQPVEDALKETEEKIAEVGEDLDQRQEAEAKAEEETQAAVKALKEFEELQTAQANGTTTQLMQQNQLKQAAEQLRKDPSMMKTAGQQLANMSPEQLEMMNKMAASQGLPQMTPEMAKMTAAKVQDMSPEDFENALKMSQQFKSKPAADQSSSLVDGGGGGGGGAAAAENPMAAMGGMGGPMAGMAGKGMAAQMEAAQKMMSDNPEMMKMAAEMMKNVSPEQMMAMSEAQGKPMSRQEAEKTANMMKNMKPEHMEKILKVAGAGQKVYSVCKRVKDAAMAYPAKQILIAFIIALFAYLVSGFM